MPQIDGNFHIVLVVKDIKQSADWYSRVFNFVVVRESIQSVLSTSSGGIGQFTSSILFHMPTRFFLGLAEHREATAESFDWRRPGIQHFGFHISQRSELDEWAAHLDKLGIEHSPILQEGPGLLVRFYDPDQIPVEVFWVDWVHCERLWNQLARDRSKAARDLRRQNQMS